MKVGDIFAKDKKQRLMIMEESNLTCEAKIIAISRSRYPKIFKTRLPSQWGWLEAVKSGDGL